MRQVGGAPPIPNAKRSLRAKAETPPADPDGDASRGFSYRLRGVLRVPRWLGPGVISERLSSWGSAVRSPVALRLPAMALGGIGVVGVLLLVGVFWIGSQMGQRAALTDEAAAPVGGSGLAVADTGGLVTPSQLAVRAPHTLDTPGGAIGLPSADPRVSGLNYLHLVSMRPADVDEARRIQVFFQQAGVRTLIDETDSDWIQVVDVSRGFTAKERRNGEHDTYFAARRALGKSWKQHNGGVGSDLNTMLFRKYEAPEVPVEGPPVALPTHDSRVPGRNYLHLVSLPLDALDEARRIQHFFQQIGVPTIVVGTRVVGVAAAAGDARISDPPSKAAGLIQVVDVSRGFTAMEISGGDHKPFLRVRRQQGRALKAGNGGVGTSLDQMIFYKFKPSAN